MAMCTSLLEGTEVRVYVTVDILDFDYDTLGVNGEIEGLKICIYFKGVVLLPWVSSNTEAS
jgi:hypothetical protein